MAALGLAAMQTTPRPRPATPRAAFLVAWVVLLITLGASVSGPVAVSAASDVALGAYSNNDNKYNDEYYDAPSTSSGRRYQVARATYCAANIAAAMNCPPERPVCCGHLSGVRCCTVAEAPNCEACRLARATEGYQFSPGTVLLGLMTLSMLLMMGSIVTNGVGHHLAWQLERRRVLKEYATRQELRRREAEDYRRELRETERDDVPEEEACVICCARYLDCALTPCGHVCCCKYCARRLKECPVCRKEVVECFQLPGYLMRQLSSLHAGAGNADNADANDAEGAGATTMAGENASPTASDDAAAAELGISREERDAEGGVAAVHVQPEPAVGRRAGREIISIVPAQHRSSSPDSGDDSDGQRQRRWPFRIVRDDQRRRQGGGSDEEGGVEMDLADATRPAPAAAAAGASGLHDDNSAGAEGGMGEEHVSPAAVTTAAQRAKKGRLFRGGYAPLRQLHDSDAEDEV